MRSTCRCRDSRKFAWQAGYDTAYGRTAIAITVAFFAAMFAFAPTPRASARRCRSPA